MSESTSPKRGRRRRKKRTKTKTTSTPPAQPTSPEKPVSGASGGGGGTRGRRKRKGRYREAKGTYRKKRTKTKGTSEGASTTRQKKAAGGWQAKHRRQIRRKVRKLSRQGKTNKEIAEALGIHRNTVSTHLNDKRPISDIYERSGDRLAKWEYGKGMADRATQRTGVKHYANEKYNPKTGKYTVRMFTK